MIRRISSLDIDDLRYVDGGDFSRECMEDIREQLEEENND